MKKIIGIYKITSPSGKIYIGQSKNVLFRWRYHYLKLHCSSQRHLYNSLVKYGADKHLFEILEECEADELDTLEIKYILEYNSTDKSIGLNHREGGNGRVVSESTRMKMSVAAIGNKNMLGKKHSEESLELMSKNRSGILSSSETKEKIRLSRLGRKHSQETRMKLSKSNKFTRKVKNTITNMEYKSITEASIVEKVNQSTIYRWLKNKKYEYVD